MRDSIDRKGRCYGDVGTGSALAAIVEDAKDEITVRWWVVWYNESVIPLYTIMR